MLISSTLPLPVLDSRTYNDYYSDFPPKPSQNSRGIFERFREYWHTQKDLGCRRERAKDYIFGKKHLLQKSVNAFIAFLQERSPKERIGHILLKSFPKKDKFASSRGEKITQIDLDTLKKAIGRQGLTLYDLFSMANSKPNKERLLKIDFMIRVSPLFFKEEKRIGEGNWYSFGAVLDIGELFFQVVREYKEVYPEKRDETILFKDIKAFLTGSKVDLSKIVIPIYSQNDDSPWSVACEAPSVDQKLEQAAVNLRELTDLATDFLKLPAFKEAAFPPLSEEDSLFLSELEKDFKRKTLDSMHQTLESGGVFSSSGRIRTLTPGLSKALTIVKWLTYITLGSVAVAAAATLFFGGITAVALSVTAGVFTWDTLVTVLLCTGVLIMLTLIFDKILTVILNRDRRQAMVLASLPDDACLPLFLAGIASSIYCAITLSPVLIPYYLLKRSGFFEDKEEMAAKNLGEDLAKRVDFSDPDIENKINAWIQKAKKEDPKVFFEKMLSLPPEDWFPTDA